ncbi:MAG: LamG domain-containing protein, partial [Thermoguttaceae bacterium]|nr:LamG domain-containing protein [Thermoguttaceae bacterium]
MNARLLAWFVFASLVAGIPLLAAQPLCEPWQTEYTGDEATGPETIALWQFNAGAETQDASGHGHTLALEGAKPHPKGRFGACLECFPGWPVEDKRHRALVKSDPRLSPTGAFTLEMWIQPKPELGADYPEAFLLDKKYVAHQDYQLILGAAERDGTRVLRACLGFGGDSATWFSRPLRLEPGQWHHVAFTYDGTGTGSFFVDGKPWGSRR